MGRWLKDLGDITVALSGMKFYNFFYNFNPDICGIVQMNPEYFVYFVHIFEGHVQGI